MEKIKNFNEFENEIPQHINEETQYNKQSQIYDLFSDYIDEFGVDSADKIVDQLQYISKNYRNSNTPKQYKPSQQVMKPDISKSWVNGN